MALVGTRERETAAEALRRHFLSGRLSLDEFGDRIRLALEARDSRDLRRALHGLPPVWRDRDELRRVGRAARRGAVVAVVAALWLTLSCLLLAAFALDVVAGGVTTRGVLGYLLAWLLASALALRAARRA